MTDLQGRVALVTGGGRDVGAAISKTLAAAGAAVELSWLEGGGGGRGG
jgi:NAD(P)-dependent dehydrogenase (short-subunit alcohol dehydrogenase family)